MGGIFFPDDYNSTQILPIPKSFEWKPCNQTVLIVFTEWPVGFRAEAAGEKPGLIGREEETECSQNGEGDPEVGVITAGPSLGCCLESTLDKMDLKGECWSKKN